MAQRILITLLMCAVISLMTQSCMKALMKHSPEYYETPEYIIDRYASDQDYREMLSDTSVYSL